jgi:transposase InsO family protein
LIVKVLATQLLHAMNHIPSPHTFGVVVLDEWDGVFCSLFLLTKPLSIRKVKLLHVASPKAFSHPPLTDVMTERPCEQLHMDLVGPTHVRSAGGKRYVLVVLDDCSRYAWVFFLEEKGETFGFVRDLVLRLRNERHGDAIRAI